MRNFFYFVIVPNFSPSQKPPITTPGRITLTLPVFDREELKWFKSILIAVKQLPDRTRRDSDDDLYNVAEFVVSENTIPEMFTVGDDKMYGDFMNKPLTGRAYSIFIGFTPLSGGLPEYRVLEEQGQ